MTRILYAAVGTLAGLTAWAFAAHFIARRISPDGRCSFCHPSTRRLSADEFLAELDRIPSTATVAGGPTHDTRSWN